MIKKNGLIFNIAPTSFAATALFALCNLSLSSSVQPSQLNYTPQCVVEEASNTYTTNSVMNHIPSEYYNTSTVREKLWNIFGETRDLTEDESDVYDKLLNVGSIETGVRLF